MNKHAPLTVLLATLAVFLPSACRGTEPASSGVLRAPVENPADKKGAPPGGPGGAQQTGEWSMQPAWHKGSNLSQVGYLLDPAGQTLGIAGRVMSIATVRQGRFLVAKTDRTLALVDAATFKVVRELDFPGKSNGGTMHGLAVAADDATVWFTSRQSQLIPAKVDDQGGITLGAPIDLAIGQNPSDPLGVALGADGRTAFVSLAITNAVAVVDLAAGQVTATIPVGVCPYGATLSKDGKTLFVSQFGGSQAKAGDRTELSAGTPVAVDARSVALRGSVAVIDTASAKVVGEIATRIHPEAMVLSPDGASLYVVDDGGDGVSEIGVAQRRVLRTLSTKPRPGMPFGSLSNGIAISADGKRLFTANAGNNAVAVIPLDRVADAPAAFIPAGGYPGSVCVHGGRLFIGNVLGFRGDLQKVELPEREADFAAMTAAAEKAFHLTEILRSQAGADAAAKAPLRAVPARVGEPSLIKHVVYIIKENKKYDQVLGDIGRGNSEPKLTEFPRATTPNIHALADAFVLLDNYYCNGVLSCDGHQHATQGLSTPYREKDWANLHGTYGFGIDPLCYAGCGFLWDQVLRQGLSFRNFGELDRAAIAPGRQWKDFYADWKAGKPPAFTGDIRIGALRNYSDPAYPGWQMAIPDQMRADLFIKSLDACAKAGRMPNLTILYLPNDHTQHAARNCPTPRAYVADNDLATGRVVEALSKSPFWKDTVVFVNEDDPQTGADHVDGHRSFCLLAGPHVKRGGQVVSRFYNQSSVIHTIDRILGLPPLNQTVAAAPLMDECFTDTPDLRPYACLPAGVPLDEMNGAADAIRSKIESTLAPLTEKIDFSAPDRIDRDADLFSRWVWSTVRGDEPFPAEYAGAHGKGLKALGLQLAGDGDGDDEDEEEEADAAAPAPSVARVP